MILPVLGLYGALIQVILQSLQWETTIFTGEAVNWCITLFTAKSNRYRAWQLVVRSNDEKGILKLTAITRHRHFQYCLVEVLLNDSMLPTPIPRRAFAGLSDEFAANQTMHSGERHLGN